MTTLLKSFITPLAYCILASTTVVASRRIVTRAACAGLVALAALVASPAPNAAAGVFTVATCEADRLNFSTQAFSHFATRRMMIKRACYPVGPGMRGLIISNVVRRGRVKPGAVAKLVFKAPAGTLINKFDWSGYPYRADCRYAVQMWAQAGQKITPMLNVKANRRCPTPGKAQAAIVVKTFKDVAGASEIVQRVICRGTRQRPWCSTRSINYLRTRWAEIELVDSLPPSVAILPNTPLASGAWVSGTQPLNYTASDNVGVQVARAFVRDQERAAHARDCLLAAPEGPFSHSLPCPNGPGQMALLTAGSPKGPSTYR